MTRAYEDLPWGIPQLRSAIRLLGIHAWFMTDEEIESAWVSFLALAPETVL